MRSLSSSRQARRDHGFGLLEVILVFAIVIGAAAVVFSVFQSAKPTSDAANEVSNYATIVGNLKTTYGIHRVYTGITPELALFLLHVDKLTSKSAAHQIRPGRRGFCPESKPVPGEIVGKVFRGNATKVAVNPGLQ